MGKLIQINNLNKSIFVDGGIKNTILKDFQFSIPLSDSGKINTIIAPFGSGKTTLLKIISGVEKYDSGKIEFSDTNFSVVPIIPENNSTLPWLNVKQNIKIWEKFSKASFSDQQIAKLIEDVGLTNYENHFPLNENSGFQIRIALARAIAFNSKIILIDDSFKDLEVETRNEIYELLNSLVLKYKFHILLATTNIIEAIFLSDRIFLMSKNPTKIFYQMENKKDFINIQSMISTESFRTTSQKIQAEFQNNSGIALIHYSV